MGSMEEDLNLFHSSVETVLSGWTALQLAVKHGFGGQDSEAKALWIVSAIEQWLSENNGIEAWEVEDFLADILSTEFDTVADDGSLSQVSRQICQYYKLCQEGKYDQVREEINRLPKAALGQCVGQSNTEEDDEMEDEENCEDEVSEQMEDMSLTEQPASGACALNTEMDSSNSTEFQEHSAVSTKENTEDSEWTVVHRPKSKKKAR